MSARQHSEAEFQSLLRRLDIALEASNIGVWEHNLVQDVLTWDARMHKLYCTTPTISALPVEIWMGAIHPDDSAGALRDFADAIARKGNYHSEFRIVWPNGAIRHIRSMANYYINSDGDPAFIGVEWDVTADVELNRALAFQQQIAEERAAALQASRVQIEYAAEHDYLTGLPNRRSFDRHCQQLLTDTTVHRLAVMHIDLDRFKQVNDERGHEAGDLVLKKTAEAMTAELEHRDFAARMGGDEFVLVAVNPSGNGEMERRADNIIRRLAAGVEFRGEHFAIGASIGIATGEGREVEPLLKDADMALYSAKRQGRGQARFYRPEPDHATPAAEPTVTDLSHALESGDIVPYYRMRFDTRTGKLVSLEAVACWNHLQKGPLFPAELNSVLRTADLAEQIDAVLVAGLVRDIADWQAQGHLVPGMSLSVPAERLASASFVDTLRNAEFTGVDFCLAVRSDGGLHDLSEPALSGLLSLRQRGLSIMLDTFADQAVSLLGFLKIRPNRLRIDCRHISPLTLEQTQLHLIHSLSELARAFDLIVVADGIGCSQQADQLRHLGLDRLLLQHTSEPLPRHRVFLDSPRLKRDLKR